MKKQYTPFTKNGETFLRETGNPYRMNADLCELELYYDFDQTALSEAKVLINPVDGRGVYEESEVRGIWQERQKSGDIWIYCIMDGYDPILSTGWEHRKAFEYIGEKSEHYSDWPDTKIMFDEQVQAERNRILAIIEAEMPNSLICNATLNKIVSKINNNGK